MKKNSTSFAVFCAVWLLIAASAPHAQTITFGSISGTTFCAGDPLSVTFTATGTWGHKNAFTLQLSNDSGTFDNGFQNIGSISDTAPGTFTIYTTAPYGLTYRQFSSTRYIDSEENVEEKDSVIKERVSNDSMYFTDSVRVLILGNDTIYDTSKIPHSLTVYDTVYDTTQIPQSYWVYDTTYDTIQPSHYRVRIMGALPYTLSADNGTDILIGQGPGKISLYYGQPGADSITMGVVGVPVQFEIQGSGTIYWNYGDGADPATFTQGYGQPKTTYSTAGLKMVTLEAVGSGGCSVFDTEYAYIFDCSTPIIPNDAIVISNDTGASYWDDSLATFIYNTVNGVDTTIELVNDPAASHPRTFWVNPGVTFYTDPGAYGYNTFDTIFAESGANIICEGGALIYLKSGATVTSPGGIIIYDTGVSIIEGIYQSAKLECSSLVYDYTVAPPNAIMAAYESVAPTVASEPIGVYPNPTNGNLTLENIPMGANVTVMNVLGETVQTENSQGNTNLSLDLSNVTAGTYYIRIASGNSITTKSIVKE